MQGANNSKIRENEVDIELQEGDSKTIKYLMTLLRGLSARMLPILEHNKVLMKTKKSLQSENESLQSQHSELQSENESLQSQHSELQSKNESLQDQNSSLQSQNSTLQNENESLQSQNSSLQSQNSSLQSDVYNLTQNCNKLNQLLSDQKKRWSRILFWISFLLNSFIKLGSLGLFLILTIYLELNTALLLFIPIALIIEASFGIASVKKEHRNEENKNKGMLLFKLTIYIARLIIAVLILAPHFGLFRLPFSEQMDIKILLLTILVTYLLASITKAIKIYLKTKTVPKKEILELLGLVLSFIGIAVSMFSAPSLIPVVFFAISATILLANQLIATCWRPGKRRKRRRQNSSSILENVQSTNIFTIKENTKGTQQQQENGVKFQY